MTTSYCVSQLLSKCNKLHSSFRRYNTTSSMSFHRIAGIIFDMDGTLTQPHLLDIHAIKQKYRLTANDDLIEEMKRNDQLNNYVVECEINAYKNCQLNHGYHELMQYIDSNHIHKAIVTRSTQLGVDAFIEYTNKQFEEIKLDNKYAVKPAQYSHTLTREFQHNGIYHFKPSAIPLQYILQQWNITSNQCLMIGDSTDDLQAARNCDMKSVLIRHHQNKQLESQADYVIDTLDQLIEIIKSIK